MVNGMLILVICANKVSRLDSSSWCLIENLLNNLNNVLIILSLRNMSPRLTEVTVLLNRDYVRLMPLKVKVL